MQSTLKEKGPSYAEHSSLKKRLNSYLTNKSTVVSQDFVSNLLSISQINDNEKFIADFLITIIDTYASHAYVVYKALYIIQAFLQANQASFREYLKNYLSEIRLIQILTFENRLEPFRSQIHMISRLIYNHLAYNDSLQNEIFDNSLQNVSKSSSKFKSSSKSGYNSSNLLEPSTMDNDVEDDTFDPFAQYNNNNISLVNTKNANKNIPSNVNNNNNNLNNNINSNFNNSIKSNKNSNLDINNSQKTNTQYTPSHFEFNSNNQYSFENLNTSKQSSPSNDFDLFTPQRMTQKSTLHQSQPQVVFHENNLFPNLQLQSQSQAQFSLNKFVSNEDDTKYMEEEEMDIFNDIPEIDPFINEIVPNNELFHTSSNRLQLA